MKYLLLLILIAPAHSFAMGRPLPKQPNPYRPNYPAGKKFKMSNEQIFTCDIARVKENAQGVAEWHCTSNKAKRISNWQLGPCTTSSYNDCVRDETGREYCRRHENRDRRAVAMFQCL